MTVAFPFRAVRNRLIRWYEVDGRTFPWRMQAESEYRVIVTETLLQQTRAETVAARRELFFSHFPDWEALRRADISDVEEQLRPFGLWRRRAASLKRLANQLESWDDKLPTSRKEIETLTGVGQYIANAVELMVFGRHLPLIDVNMARVLGRLAEAKSKADLRYDPLLQSYAIKLIGKKNFLETNFACLDLAALICLPRKPACHNCPVSQFCAYFLKQTNK